MTKTAYSLVGVDGNAYALMGYTQRAMRESGRSKEHMADVLDRAKAGDYNNLVCVLDNKLTKINDENGLLEDDDGECQCDFCGEYYGSAEEAIACGRDNPCPVCRNISRECTCNDYTNFW